MRLFAAVLLVFAGCTPDDTDVPDTDVADADTDTDTDSDTDTDTEAPLGASLSGKVLDEDGKPVAARVNVCRDLCKTKSTDATGAYAFDDIEPWTASFYVIPTANPTPYSTPMVPLTLEKGPRTLDVLMPRFKSTALPAAHKWLSVSEGLDLDIGLDLLDEPKIGEIGDVVTVSRLAPEDALPIELAGTALDVYYIGPFEIESEAGVSVRLTETYGLAEGDKVELYASSLPTEYKWLPCGTLTLTGGVWTGTAKLPILTTLVVVKP
jgi:hypothetical protein